MKTAILPMMFMTMMMMQGVMGYSIALANLFYNRCRKAGGVHTYMLPPVNVIHFNWDNNVECEVILKLSTATTYAVQTSCFDETSTITSASKTQPLCNITKKLITSNDIHLNFAKRGNGELTLHYIPIPIPTEIVYNNGVQSTWNTFCILLLVLLYA